MEFLKDHPFAVSAFFERSLVLSYAVPKAALSPFLPDCLAPDLLNDQWGFIAAAFVQTKNLRPKGFPAFMGHDFFLTGFRIFVRYRTNAGKNLRGLFILGSETNKWKMAMLGNIFTHYHYVKTDINSVSRQNETSITSRKSGMKIIIDTTEGAHLPQKSPFRDWKEARRFAGPLPFTFSYNARRKEVLIVEGLRENWNPAPVQVIQHDIGFINKLQLPGLVLANAFMIENIPYQWKKGKKERWQG